MRYSKLYNVRKQILGENEKFVLDMSSLSPNLYQVTMVPVSNPPRIMSSTLLTWSEVNGKNVMHHIVQEEHNEITHCKRDTVEYVGTTMQLNRGLLQIICPLHCSAINKGEIILTYNKGEWWVTEHCNHLVL